ncbi:MAG: 30S ribosomal protein S17, partial [Candidatus Gribaldobacteria bacterium]|nr:30S ribosomal protein S17 [Candidatus Gribaldobacteria bacterium]
VKVDRMVIHPKYRKRYQVTTRYKADKASLECNVGDKVVIQESRPISRDKKWILLSVQKNQQAEVE